MSERFHAVSGIAGPDPVGGGKKQHWPSLFHEEALRQLSELIGLRIPGPGPPEENGWLPGWTPVPVRIEEPKKHVRPAALQTDKSFLIKNNNNEEQKNVFPSGGRGDRE